MEVSGNNSDQDYLYEQSNKSKNESLINDLNNFSELNKLLSTITKTSTIITKFNTGKDIINHIKILIPYQNLDEIPLIKIKDENHFEDGKEIENYIINMIKPNDKEYDNKFNICKQCTKEKNKFFCEECNKNICDKCYEICLNKNHNLIELKIYFEEIKEIKENIELIISKNFILMEEEKSADKIEKKNIYYELKEEIELEANNKIGENLNKYTNDIILIEAIIEKNYFNFFHYMNIKECFNYLRNKFDYIIIHYKIEKDKTKIRIFGKDFVNNNKDKCQIIYANKNLELTEYLDLNNLEKKEILEIKLIGINKVTNMNGMFSNCYTLISLPDISKWNTNNVADMSWIFSNCKSLISLPDISKWNTNKVINMSYMFNFCSSLISLPDISKWKTNKVIDMSGMFGYCKSLIWLPDISKWKINKVIDMSGMFSYCKSLYYLPDISKWFTNNKIYIRDMFDGCESLKKIGEEEFSEFEKKYRTKLKNNK